MHKAWPKVAMGLLVLILAGTGLSHAQPSERAGRQVFTAIQKDKLGGTPFEIRSFRKTNGSTAEVFGVRVYVMEYSASVRYPKGLRPDCIRSGNAFAGWDCFHAQSQQGIRPQPAGSTETMTGELTFQKTERGWRGQDNVLY